MRFAPLFGSPYNLQNLPTTFLFEGILHKLLFGGVFISDMVGRRVAVFWKFLVHFASANPSADSDFLLLKEVSRRILQTVLSRLQPPRKMYYSPINKAMLSTNIHATLIVGMWVVHPKGCRTE